MVKTMWTPKKKIYITLLILTLLVEIPIFFRLKNNFYPYLIKPKQETYNATGHFDYFYHDLNNDGNSEFFEIENNPTNQAYNVKIYQFNNNISNLINQWNFHNTIHIKDIAFKDLDNDGWQEIIVFTHDENGLYLAILNVINSNLLTSDYTRVATHSDSLTYSVLLTMLSNTCFNC